MRYPLSQQTIQKRALSMMTDYAKLRDMPANRKDRDVLIDYISGMELMARQMGVDCGCHLSKDKTRPLCECRLLPERATKLMSGCRDDKGRFLSLAECSRSRSGRR